MQKWFGDAIDEQGPIAFLQSHGYTLTRGWEWVKPVSAHTISTEEWECIAFLCDEWDFGGIAQHTEEHAFEIWQDGDMVAAISASNFDEASAEAIRYLFTYAQDGKETMIKGVGADKIFAMLKPPDFLFEQDDETMIGELK